MDQATKAALKQDHFVTTTGSGLEWASENRKSVIVTVSLLLLAILVLVVGVVIYNQRSQAASEAFGAAMQAYQTPVNDPIQPTPPGVKTYANPTERAKVANALFVAAADKYSLMKDGKNARYFAGLTYMEAGQNTQAEQTLSKIAGGFDRELGNLAKLSLAGLYRQTNRDEQAINELKDLADKPSTTVPAGLAQLQLADVYTAEGKPDQARKIYAQLKDKDAKGAAGIIAAQKLNPAAAAEPGAGPQ